MDVVGESPGGSTAPEREGGGQGFSVPSPPTAALAVTLVGICYALLPHGRRRTFGIWTAAAIILILWFARVYLAVDHLTDGLSGIILGAGIAVVAFRLVTP